MIVEELPVIRIHADEYDRLPNGSDYTHFNLAPAYHEVGVLYSLPRIVERGSFRNGAEILPVLDHVACRVGRCVGFRSKIAYEELVEDDFTNSMIDLRTNAALQDRIVERYSRLRPWMQRTELLALGVSATMLRFEDS